MKEKTKMIWQKIKPYILPYSVAIAIPLVVGISSAAITRADMQVYSRLNTPPLAPPSWIFPIVWTLLYILMGISSGMIFVKRKSDLDASRQGLVYYTLSLVLNFAWSIVFFKFQAAFFAFIILIALLISIIKTIIEYRKIYPIAAYLQIPYTVWVAFAGYLNAGIWLMN